MGEEGGGVIKQRFTLITGNLLREWRVEDLLFWLLLGFINSNFFVVLLFFSFKCAYSVDVCR